MAMCMGRQTLLCSSELPGGRICINDNKYSLSSDASPGLRGRRHLRAARAVAIEQQLVAGNAKAARRPGQHGAGAAPELVHASTFAAVEMMMVGLAGDLVAGSL